MALKSLLKKDVRQNLKTRPVIERASVLQK